MKLKFLRKLLPHKKMVNIVGNVVYSYLHLLEIFWRYKIINGDAAKSPVIYAMWHGGQWGLGVLVDYKNRVRRKNINILVSLSDDGDYISKICELLGFSLVRGSTNRHGDNALREMITLLKNGKDIAFMVDGPRGPKQRVKPGLIRLAKLSGVPIVPIMPYSPNVIKMNSWDNYQIPMGFLGKAIMLIGEPIIVPEDIDKEQEKEYIKKVEDALFDLEKDVIVEHKHCWGEKNG